jgi:hypothetical protein
MTADEWIHLCVGVGVCGHRQLAQPRGDPLGRRQRVTVGLGQWLGAVLGDLDRRGLVAQRVFGDRLVGALAQDQPDRRIVGVGLDQVVDGGEVAILTNALPRAGSRR